VAEDLLHERRRNERTTTTTTTTNSSSEIIIGSNLALIQYNRDCSIGKIRWTTEELWFDSRKE